VAPSAFWSPSPGSVTIAVRPTALGAALEKLARARDKDRT
jgi:hypothetical protein